MVLYAHAGLAEPLFLSSSDGQVYRLEDPGTSRWKALTASELLASQKEDFAFGDLRIDQNKVEVRSGTRWKDLGVRLPPSGLTYETAFKDGNGGIAISLGGAGNGFNYKFPDGPVVVWNRSEWKGVRPELTQLSPSPSGVGFIGVDAEGEIFHIDPPTRQRREFVATSLGKRGKGTQIIALESGETALSSPGKPLEMLRADLKSTALKLPKAVGSQSWEVSVPFRSNVHAQLNQKIQAIAPPPPPPQLALKKNTSKETTTTKKLPKEAASPATVGERQRTPQRFTDIDLSRAIEERIQRVEEFKFIREQAERLGLRVWLFGGTAAAYAHYVNWDLKRESGDESFQAERFQYDYTDIFRSNQDADLVVSGDEHAAGELESLLKARFHHFEGNKTKWEVRMLETKRGDKEPLLNQPDFLNQHTDSNSTGLIEVTAPKKGEFAIRDLRDWDADWKKYPPQFFTDIAEGKLHYYFSDTHSETSRYKQGLNPPILSVIRYFTKAFQYELQMRSEDLNHIKKIIEAFRPESVQSGYVATWIEKNGKKLIQNAVSIEFALKTMRDVGLAQKLIAINDDAHEIDTLAWWLNKVALESKPLSAKGRTAKELGIDIVAHETRDFLAYESITRSPTGKPNVLTSRSDASGENAIYGDGFYTAMGERGARGTGMTIRFEVDPMAREGEDFSKQDEIVIFHNRNALRVIPESFEMSPVELVNALVSEQYDVSNLALLEKLSRKISPKSSNLSQEELDEINEILRKAIRARRFVPVLKTIGKLGSPALNEIAYSVVEHVLGLKGNRRDVKIGDQSLVVTELLNRPFTRGWTNIVELFWGHFVNPQVFNSYGDNSSNGYMKNWDEAILKGLKLREAFSEYGVGIIAEKLLGSHSGGAWDEIAELLLERHPTRGPEAIAKHAMHLPRRNEDFLIESILAYVRENPEKVEVYIDLIKGFLQTPNGQKRQDVMEVILNDMSTTPDIARLMVKNVLALDLEKHLPVLEVAIDNFGVTSMSDTLAKALVRPNNIHLTYVIRLLLDDGAGEALIKNVFSKPEAAAYPKLAAEALMYIADLPRTARVELSAHRNNPNWKAIFEAMEMDYPEAMKHLSDHYDLDLHTCRPMFLKLAE